MTIWKCRVELMNEPVVQLPRDAKILSFQFQRGEPTLWALVEPKNALMSRHLRLLGTGNPCPAGVESWRFIGTIQQGPFVWHLFDPTEAAR